MNEACEFCQPVTFSIFEAFGGLFPQEGLRPTPVPQSWLKRMHVVTKVSLKLDPLLNRLLDDGTVMLRVRVYGRAHGPPDFDVSTLTVSSFSRRSIAFLPSTRLLLLLLLFRSSSSLPPRHYTAPSPHHGAGSKPLRKPPGVLPLWSPPLPAPGRSAQSSTR